MTSPTATPYKRLTRPRDDRMIAGVCSGVGRYFGIDPNLIRVAFAVAVILTWCTALIAYPVMWFLMPEDQPDDQPVAQPAPYTPSDTTAG